MVKALIVALAVALLLWLLFGRGRRGGGEKTSSRRRDELQAESMVACAHCGVHLPRGDALAARGLHYCSAEHRDGPPAP